MRTHPDARRDGHRLVWRLRADRTGPAVSVERAMFACRRCGLDVTEWGGICRDCQAVLNTLRERDRWRCDYSKAMRRAMSRMIRQDGGAIIAQPRRGRGPTQYVTP